MADTTNSTTAASAAFGQRTRDLRRATSVAQKKRSSLIKRDQGGFELRWPAWSKPAWLALAIVPAPFLVPFLWPDAPGGFNSSLEAAAAPRAAMFVSVVAVAAADAEMDAAIARARSGLTAFLDKAEEPAGDERGFALKVALPTRAGTLEHIWTANIQRVGAKFQGQVVNAPIDVEGIKAGSTIEFEELQISDWMFRRGGKIVGNETMRPLLKSMPEAQAARYRAMLADR